MAPFVPYILDRYPRHACCSDSVEEKEQAEWIWKTNEDKWMPRRVATCDGDKTLRCPGVRYLIDEDRGSSPKGDRQSRLDLSGQLQAALAGRRA